MDRFVFPPWVNRLTPLVLAGLLGGGAYVGFLFGFGTLPGVMNDGYSPDQPVPFSHRLHAGELKMDCRYCHTTVEKAAMAAVPSTNICANCHSKAGQDGTTPYTAVHANSLKLLPLHQSQATGESVEWQRVHDLADYVYFNHSVHVNRGVGCSECHGRIDRMDQVTQVKPLSMSWCLECHRDPAPRLRPPSEVTNMEWDSLKDPGHVYPEVEAIAEHIDVTAITSCSTCHR